MVFILLFRDGRLFLLLLRSKSLLDYGRLLVFTGIYLLYVYRGGLGFFSMKYGKV